MSFIAKSIIPIVLTAIFTVGLLCSGQLSKKLNIVVSDNSYINGQFNCQILVVLITGMSILATFLLNRQKGTAYPTTIFFISAILFGLPHYAGMPNGIVGATMAGVLGFVL